MSLLLAAALVAAAAAPARAYLDPGGGSMLAQLAAAGVGGLVILVKLYWNRIKEKLGRGGPKPPAPPP